jgi:hypothetical protein
MFIIREYGACVIVVLLLAALVLVIYGIGYLLKVIGTVLVRVLQAVARRRSMRKLVAMSFRRRSLIRIGTEPNVIEDYPS